MDFIGVDLGWQNKPTGLAHLSLRGGNLRLHDATRRTGTQAVLAWMDDRASDALLIAVDAPLIIANPSGMRPVDRLMHNHFGKYHAGCYPANLSRPFATLTTGFSQSLATRGYDHAVSIEAKRAARYQIEVYPHTGIVNLFDLQHILRYKRGRVSDRRASLCEYRDLLLTRLCELEPKLVCERIPDVPSGGTALKDCEDQLDAIICAYVGAHWWYWGTARNTVFGDLSTGYIVVPDRCLPPNRRHQ